MCKGPNRSGGNARSRRRSFSLRRWRSWNAGSATGAPKTRQPSAAGWSRPGGNSPAPRNFTIKSLTKTWTRRPASCARSSLVCLRGEAMLDDLKEEGIVNKVGGRFKLSTLIQKRMVALNTGAKPHVEVKGGDRMAIVMQEILQDKIYLDLEGNLKTREAYEAEAPDFNSLGNISDD